MNKINRTLYLSFLSLNTIYVIAQERGEMVNEDNKTVQQSVQLDCNFAYSHKPANKNIIWCAETTTHTIVEDCHIRPDRRYSS